MSVRKNTLKNSINKTNLNMKQKYLIQFFNPSVSLSHTILYPLLSTFFLNSLDPHFFLCSSFRISMMKSF
ncbi:unnamed protein product [Citrullus colocynthis]|uniref:Uncharacterized protein n=1 Tax=Citrullus colocynthis TaxID=252529 RepID=A0ABP0XWA3_9ROSI